MPLKLYNTRTQRVEPLVPLRDSHVRLYVCGLTPSAQAHLGHARSFLFFDLLRRYLIHLGYGVTYVQNVTDIDDRSIARAAETGEDWHAIVQGYYDGFKTSMHALDVAGPDVEPYATDFIPQIQIMIRELVEAGHAYATADGVYYRVSTFANYGRLSGRNLDELQAGARIAIDERKDDPLDFALWKFAKPGEPFWPFEGFGQGRPGWHIECSAMARAILDPEGLGFDIHGGGADLIFPHHENEIAQSEPLMAHPPMANLWVHGGLLLFDSRKMSKSLGNFEPLENLLERYDPQAIRLLFLRTGYSKVMNFTDEAIAAAGIELERLKKVYRAMHMDAQPVPSDLRATGLLARIETALNEDMNLAVALAELVAFASSWKLHAANAGRDAALYEYGYALTLLGIEPKPEWLIEPQAAELPFDFLKRLVSAAAVAPEFPAGSFDGLTAERAIERVLEVRGAARARKDWASSDRLRDILLDCGVAINDGKGETAWTVAG